MALVYFEREGKTLSVNSGQNLRKLASANGISLFRGINKIFNCHGMGLCTACVVEIFANRPMDLSPRTAMEEKKLDGFSNPNLRLACQVQVHGSVRIKSQPVEFMAAQPNSISPPLVSGNGI